MKMIINKVVARGIFMGKAINVSEVVYKTFREFIQICSVQ